MLLHTPCLVITKIIQDILARLEGAIAVAQRGPHTIIAEANDVTVRCHYLPPVTNAVAIVIAITNTIRHIC
jgi:hypothetical protein